MIEKILFFLFFYLLIFSVIGYGNFVFNLVSHKDAIKSTKNNNYIYFGFYGLAFITLISFITSYFTSHGYIHNAILHLTGFYFFFKYSTHRKIFFKKLIILTTISIPILLISKTHDDFSYYHFPFTKYLIEQNIIFGMGYLNLGYNLISSIFFLNSTFYLPFIEYYSFHFPIIYFLIFFNLFVISEIYTNRQYLIKYFYIFAFCFFNLSFNRLAEYGTDKSGQLLIILIIIKLIDNIFFNKNKNIIHELLILVPLLGYCITIKTYFIPYIILGLLVFLINKNFFESLKQILFSKSFLFFLTFIVLNFSHHFISTGCFISPISFTCLNIAEWGLSKEDIFSLSKWLEQWAKAGAGPNFRVEDPALYIQNFNWIGNWFSKYFLVKFLDQLMLLITILFICFFIFKKFKFSKTNSLKKNKVFCIFFLLTIIATIWLIKHPTLRYGGYSIFFLITVYPLLFFFLKFQNVLNFNKRLLFLIIFIFSFVILKNLLRINDEFDREDHYRFSNFPYFAIKEVKYRTIFYDKDFKINFSESHCWGTPSPCGNFKDNIKVKKLGISNYILKK